MPFCPTCESILYRKNKHKCLKCDSSITSTENTTIEPTSSFPFEIGKYYTQQFIRKKCIAHPRWGISQNPIEHYWIVIKNKKSKSNTYYDRIGADGFYHYTGQGLTGNQKMENVNNYGLKNAKSKDQKIHLFWQENMGSDHKYLGEVEVVNIVQEKQTGLDKRPRDVFIFSFKILD